MSLRSTGSTLSYKSQQSSTLSHIKTSNEKLPTVTFVKSNHIHYDPPDKIGINYIQLKISQLYSDHEVRTATSYSYIVRVECNRPDNVWIMRRNVADFKILDHLLHGGCSATSSSRERGLPNLHPPDVLDKGRNRYSEVYSQYRNYIDRLNKFLQEFNENGNLLMLIYFNCSLILSWFELGHDGKHKVYSVSGGQNFSNFGASRNAIVKSRFPKQGIGDLSLEVNDIMTVMETPVATDSVWSRGKSDKTFQSGLFPSRCVEDFQFTNAEKPNFTSCPGLQTLVQEEEKLFSPPSEEPAPRLLAGRSPHSSRRGDQSHLPVEVNPDFPAIFGSTLQTAMKWNYSLRDAKQNFKCTILSELYTSQNCEESLEHVPCVIQSMIEHVQKYGSVDGIYRLNGSSSEILTLISSLDSGHVDLDWSNFDIHSVSSLLKQYFRDLSVSLIPANNYAAFIQPLVSRPELLTEQYKMNDLEIGAKDSLRWALDEILEQLYLLPCTYYHTLKLLMLHLNLMVSKVEMTNMNLYNLAIMWAPNLLFDPLEKNCQDYIEIAKKAKETAARKGKLMEIMIAYAGHLFCDKLTKSTLQHINEIGCNDKLRGRPRYENEDYETVILANRSKDIPISNSVKERDGKNDKFKFMIQKWFSKTEKMKEAPKKQRSTSLIHPYESYMQRDENSYASGLYSCIGTGSTSTKDLRENPATPDSFDDVKGFKSNHDYNSFDSLERSEYGSEDSTIAGFSQNIGASRHTDLEHSTSTIMDDPENHIYSQIQKSKNSFSRRSESFITAKAFNVQTYDEDQDEVFKSTMPPRSTCPKNLRLLSNGSSSNSMTKEDAIPFIDSTSPTSASSTPFMFKHGRNELNKSKDSSIDMIEKDLEPVTTKSSVRSPVQRRQPTAGFGYDYNAGCTLDNFSSDRAYIPASNATYQRYFNREKSIRRGPKSVTPLRTYRPRNTNTDSAANLMPRSRPVQEASPLLFRQSPLSSHPIVSPERLKASGEGSETLQKGNLKGNWGTAYSFDSGVENNGSSNDDLLSNT